MRQYLITNVYFFLQDGLNVFEDYFLLLIRHVICIRLILSSMPIHSLICTRSSRPVTRNLAINVCFVRVNRLLFSSISSSGKIVQVFVKNMCIR